MRSSVSPGADNAIFRRTASATRLINVRPHIARGGIRL